MSLYVQRLDNILNDARRRFDGAEITLADEPVEGEARRDTPGRELHRRIIAEVQKIDELPGLPDVVQRLDRVIGSPRSNAKDIADVLTLDPALAAQMLRLVNSALFGLKREVRQLSQAVVFLGIREVRSLAMTASILNVFTGKPHPSFDHHAFWQHSMGTAIASKLIAKALIEKNQTEVEIEDAFLAGLMHDIGKIVLASVFADDYVRTRELARSAGIRFYEAELSVLGIRHGEIGRILLERWGMPESVTHAVAYHHDPLKRGVLPNVVHLADHVARGLGFVPEPCAGPLFHPEVWAELDLADDVIEGLACQTIADFQEVERLLDGPEKATS